MKKLIIGVLVVFGLNACAFPSGSVDNADLQDGLGSAGGEAVLTDGEDAPVKETTVSLTIVDENGNSVAPDAEGGADMSAGAGVGDGVVAGEAGVEGNPVVDADDVKSADAPRYVNFTSELYDELRAAKKPFVLFFHADWDPVCRSMELNINEDLDSFPAGTIIVKTNYDREKALKQEFDINIQSTVVVLNGNGDQVYKATEPALDDFKAAIEKSLEV